MIPQTYNEWRNCIVNDCNINLTKEFAEERLKIYKDSSNPQTKKFIELYGNQHLYNIISWLNNEIQVI